MNASGFKPALPGISSSKRLGFFSFSGGNQPFDLKPRGVFLTKAAMEETRTLKLDVNGKVGDKLPNGHAGKNHNQLSTIGNSTNIKWHECPVEKIDRQKLLKQKGCVIWITGLSGSGKSTVACALSHMLYQRGNLSYILDGDNIRHGLNRDLSFKAEDRAENIRRVGEVAKLFADAGFICIACLISPYRRDRAECRAMLPSEGFVEVFMDVPLQVCENRDPKGLYKLARAGKIKGFTGIDDPYEPPLDAEIVLQCNTGDCSTPCDMAEKVISYLEGLFWLRWCFLSAWIENFSGGNRETALEKCLENPLRPQYNGGIIGNPELNDGLRAWSTFGDAKTEHRESNGNKYVVAHSRNNPYASMSQKLYLKKNHLYTFSAWVQVSEGNVQVTAIFKTDSGFKKAGSVFAEPKCWSMLKGGLTVDTSGPAELYFESNNTSVEIWVDSISLQPFTEKEWRSHQDQSIERTRKEKVRIQAIDEQSNPLSNATISIKQNKLRFPFGCAINKNILSNTAYQDWFTSRFGVTAFEDEMKWYSTEATRGQVDYSVPDAMLAFAKQHNIAVRGHNVIWDDPKYQNGWVRLMDSPKCMFLNEYDTIEKSGDGAASPAKYLQKLKEIQSFPGNANLRMGIGLESHFTIPNLPYMRASLDTLASANVPIWLTEVDVQGNPAQQAQYLEQILREAYSYPKIAGIVIWSAWKPQGCYRMCLTDNNFKNLATGDVVDKLLHEWGGSLIGMTDANGFFEASLSHGDYNVKIIRHGVTDISSSSSNLKVAPTVASRTTLIHQVTA
ncbi:hypothetical protein NC651_022439 [Populus alba x Populus x berolinensis]|nr:hypothetical protein NC651_022439 [Populus alba x Populus x berolinensis]